MMFGRLTQRNVVVIDTSTYREVGIHFSNSRTIYNIESPFYLAVLDTSTISDLKRRINGLTKISVPSMILMFCGEALEDGVMIPEEAFETHEKRNFEEDLFQAKGNSFISALRFAYTPSSSRSLYHPVIACFFKTSRLHLSRHNSFSFFFLFNF